MFGCLDMNINNLVSELNQEGGDMDEIAKLKQVSSSFWSSIHLKDNLIEQQSGSKCVKEGDAIIQTFFMLACRDVEGLIRLSP